jgi:hypothetical protein
VVRYQRQKRACCEISLGVTKVGGKSIPQAVSQPTVRNQSIHQDLRHDDRVRLGAAFDSLMAICKENGVSSLAGKAFSPENRAQ